jgi:hypothetical protein
MLFQRACPTTRSATKGSFQIRKYVELGFWGKPSPFQIAWWKTPKVASTHYVLVEASFVAIRIGGASRRQGSHDRRNG